MRTILITGSNRGLGLELVDQYAQAGWRVFATCRHPAEASKLQQLVDSQKNISLHRLDITNRDEIKAITWELKDTPLDILFNNAGVYLEPDYNFPVPGGFRYEDWLRTLDVNTLGPMRVTEALLENVGASKTRLVAVMTSHMGSISDIETQGSYYYRSSKAALNAAMQGLSVALHSREIGVLMLHPGAVATRMGAAGGITTKKSVRGIRQVIDDFSLQDTGAFLKYDGTRLPW